MNMIMISEVEMIGGMEASCHNFQENWHANALAAALKGRKQLIENVASTRNMDWCRHNAGD